MEARERILYAKSENYFCTKVNRWPFWAEWAETTHLIYQYLISVNTPKWLISSVILRRDPTSSYKKKVIEYLKKLGLPTHSGNMRPGIVLHRADKHRQSLWGFHAVDCGHHMQIQGDLRVSDGFSGQTWNHLNTCLLTRSAGTPWLDGHSRWRSREVLLWLAVGYWCCI